MQFQQTGCARLQGNETWRDSRSSIHRSPLPVYIVSRFHVDQTFSNRTITRLCLFSRAQHFQKVSRYIKIGRPVLSLLIIVLRIALSLSFLASPPFPRGNDGAIRR